MTTVVSAHISPATSPSASPSQASGCAPAARPASPSPSASPTPTNAAARPSHCQVYSRSPGIKRGSSKATQKGELYKNTVSREAEVYCKPT